MRVKYGDWVKTSQWSKIYYRFRIDPVPRTGGWKRSHRSILPRKRLRKELDSTLGPFIRAKRKSDLQVLLDAWRWDWELTPSNIKDRNWKQYGKKRKQWMKGKSKSKYSIRKTLKQFNQLVRKEF